MIDNAHDIAGGLPTPKLSNFSVSFCFNLLFLYLLYFVLREQELHLMYLSGSGTFRITPSSHNSY